MDRHRILTHDEVEEWTDRYSRVNGDEVEEWIGGDEVEILTS